MKGEWGPADRGGKAHSGRARMLQYRKILIFKSSGGDKACESKIARVRFGVRRWANWIGRLDRGPLASGPMARDEAKRSHGPSYLYY